MSYKIKRYIHNHLEQFLVVFLTGFFIFFVLFFYKGYNIQQGISYSGHGLLFRAISFGLITSFSFFINEFYIAGLFNLQNIKRKIIWNIWEIFIGANFTFILFNYFWNWTEWDWNGYILMLSEYTLVMIFPIMIGRSIANKRKKTPVDNEMMVFESENENQKLLIKPEHLLYLKSEDNYVEIFYLSDGKVKNSLIRNTLKHIERKFSDNEWLVRCHRSYIVNPKKIININKTNRQIILDLGYSKQIPVSKKYQSDFADNFDQFHLPLR